MCIRDSLKWVGIIATGTDNLDLEACRRHGVAVANVPGYSTYSVAQMTFSLRLAICQCAERYNRCLLYTSSDGAKSDLANVLGLFDVDNTVLVPVTLSST